MEQLIGGRRQEEAKLVGPEITAAQAVGEASGRELGVPSGPPCSGVPRSTEKSSTASGGSVRLVTTKRVLGPLASASALSTTRCSLSPLSAASVASPTRRTGGVPVAFC